MTQEEKDLLLKDLSARLPYGVNVRFIYNTGEPCYGTLMPQDIQWFIGSKIEIIKPYLRPLLSMTDEEREEYRKFSCYGAVGVRPYTHGDVVAVPSFEKMDWLNAHHFDYRGLIEKGLALEASEGMYNG